MLDDIVSIMIKQHRELQKNLGDVDVLLHENDVQVNKIEELLNVFVKNLSEHLELENNTFYVELLEKMKKAGYDTEKTEEFIVQMKDIEVKVIGFIEKYKLSFSIKSELEDFKVEFAEMVIVLRLRIESEEAGVYGLY